MYDKNDEPWDLEAYLAGISDSDERARTRREFGGLGGDEDDGPDDNDGPTLAELVALPVPAGGEACEVDFYTGEPVVPPSPENSFVGWRV